MCLTSQPLSRNSTASQSSSSGWTGHSPWAPRSSTRLLMPVPKSCFQSRFTNTRAVSGFSGEVSHLARSSRVSRLPFVPDGWGRKWGTAGSTTAPLWSCQLPRGRTRVTGGGSGLRDHRVGPAAVAFAAARGRATWPRPSRRIASGAEKVELGELLDLRGRPPLGLAPGSPAAAPRRAPGRPAGSKPKGETDSRMHPA